MSVTKSLEIVKETETPTSYFRLTSDGIVIAQKKKDCFVELEDAKLNAATHREMAGNRPVPCMIILEEMQNTSTEALEFYSDPVHGEYRSAEAFVVENLGVRLIVDHYMKHSKMPYPRQTFATEKEAINWLRSFNSN